MIFGLPLGSHLATIGKTIRCKKNICCRRVPRRVPGRDLGSILGGFEKYLYVFLKLCFMFCWVSFSIAFYIGYAWNVYEVGMA